LAPDIVDVSIAEPFIPDPVLEFAEGFQLEAIFRRRFTAVFPEDLQCASSWLSRGDGCTREAVYRAGGFDEARSKYYRAYDLYLNAGRYTLKAFLAGCRPISFPELM
jgi:hypothetical protein